MHGRDLCRDRVDLGVAAFQKSSISRGRSSMNRVASLTAIRPRKFGLFVEGDAEPERQIEIERIFLIDCLDGAAIVEMVADTGIGENAHPA